MEVMDGALTLCMVTIFIGVYLHLRKKGQRVTNMAPELKGALPIIGHLHLLPADVPLHLTFDDIADRIGPVFTVRLGRKRTLVVSSWEAVKDCFGTNDRIFQTRPESAAAKYMGYNYAQFGLSPYGHYWREIRKFVSVHLLSNSRLEQLKPVLRAELAASMGSLFSLSRAGPVDMGEWFSQVVMNNMTLMLAGKRYANVDENNEEAGRFLMAIFEYFHLLGAFVLSDAVRFTEWLDYKGRIKAMKRVAKELDCFMSSWLEEHVRRRREGVVKKEDGDFMDIMLSKLDEQDWSSSFDYPIEDIIKATAMNLILAGVDTTSETLIWALSLLLNHVEVFRKCQKEMDLHVGKERWVDDSDLKNLPYLMAIVKETLRMYPPGPLNIPREALEDCTVVGYHIPKGTQLLVNIWKLHRDARVWLDPNEFQPERFLTTQAQHDVRGKNAEFIPFSVGRRGCPGISSAMQTTCLTLARVVQGFNMSTPDNKKVDMNVGIGISLPKLVPLKVVLTPRLPFDLYKL